MSETNKFKIAWITGASSGIGRALALKMASEEWTVAATARSVASLTRLADEAKMLPGTIYPFAADVTDSSQICSILERIENSCGAIDLAVLNAGTYVADTAKTTCGKNVTALMQLNFVGTINCLHPLVKKMRSRSTGAIAVVSSLAGYVGLPGAAAYGASKAALINLTESLRPELYTYGIKLQVINPGFVKTPLTDKNQFKMPFLMEVDDAADVLYKGLKSDKFEITFPTRFSIIMKLLRFMPYKLFFFITKRLLHS